MQGFEPRRHLIKSSISDMWLFTDRLRPSFLSVSDFHWSLTRKSALSPGVPQHVSVALGFATCLFSQCLCSKTAATGVRSMYVFYKFSLPPVDRLASLRLHGDTENEPLAAGGSGGSGAMVMLSCIHHPLPGRSQPLRSAGQRLPGSRLPEWVCSFLLQSPSSIDPSSWNNFPEEPLYINLALIAGLNQVA